MPLKKAKRPAPRKTDKAEQGEIPGLGGGYFVEEFIPYLLNQLTNTMNQRFKAALKRFHLSISQWRVLATLRTGPDLSLTDIARLTAIDQPTLSRIVDQLVERDLVTRAPRRSDGRFVAIGLTGQGEELLARAWPVAWSEAQATLGPLDEAERTALRGLLRKMLEGLAD